MQWNRVVRVLVPVTAIVVSGCIDELPVTPTPPAMASAGATFGSRTGAVLRNVREVRIDLPPARRAWDTSSTALAEAIARGQNYAVIAFKEPTSQRALSSGIRAAVSALTVGSALTLLRERGVEVLAVFEAMGAAQVRISPAVAAVLREHPLVDFIEPRQYGRVASQSTPWGISMVQAPSVWGITTGAGAAIMIVDTGHDQGHEDLPAVLSWHCAGQYGGCDDGNGHGTNVMGIAMARNNSIGVVGVAPGISDVDVYVYGACDDVGDCPTDEVTYGINAGLYVIDVINLSLQQPYDAGQATATALAWLEYNIVIVAAAGNNAGNTVVYPAAYFGVVGVSGVNDNKSFANPSMCVNTSNWGSHVDIAAPILANATLPFDTYGARCGTSMATPHVSGVAALLRANNPGWTNQQIVERILLTAEDRGAGGKDVHFGYGILDAYLALTYQPTNPPFLVTITGNSQIAPYTGCLWSASVNGGAEPYSYSWKANGVAVGGNSSTLSYTPGGSDFTLEVTVYDDMGRLAYDDHPVTIVQNAWCS